MKEQDKEMIEFVDAMCDDGLKDCAKISTMYRVYNDAICDIIDDYDCGAFYEPSYCIVRAYRDGGF